MIITKLQGGLGNQMFQYAFGSYLAQKHNTGLRLDVSFLLDHTIKGAGQVNRDFDLGIFGIDENFASKDEAIRFKNRTSFVKGDKALNKIFGLKKSYIREPHYHFSGAAFNSPDNIYLEGYWQTEKYFKPIESYIRQKFVIKDKLLPQSELLKQEISTKSAVCVNIRRGDFSVNPFHGTLPASYYSVTEKIILNKVDNPHLYVFSDDIEWCIQNLSFASPVTFVSHEYAGNKFRDYLTLMIACKHFIIPNSTFAWWAAYLANNSNKIVIAPRKWYNDPSWETKDLLLPDWIKIDE